MPVDHEADFFRREERVRIYRVVCADRLFVAAQLAHGHEGSFDAIHGIDGDFTASDGGAKDGADDADDGVDGARRVLLLA